VVSLTEQPLSPASLSDNGIVAEHIPVADFTVPTIEQIERAVTTIDHFLAAGYASAVHCAAGPGRTGTILACALVARGQLATAAIGHVRAVWPGSIETPEQAAAVEQYERHLATG
ncbi:MAG TPA: protein phosphatase, partial [Chloroflexota bacterium]|jgi:atypical dual specificity phosphatase